MDKEYRNYLNRCRNQRPDVKAKNREYAKRYRETHPDYMEKHRKSDIEYYKRNRSVRASRIAYYNARSCRDPVVGDVCKYNTLIRRKLNHPDLYEGVNTRECIIKVPRIKGLDEELKKEYGME